MSNDETNEETTTSSHETADGVDEMDLLQKSAVLDLLQRNGKGFKPIMEEKRYFTLRTVKKGITPIEWHVRVKHAVASDVVLTAVMTKEVEYREYDKYLHPRINGWLLDSLDESFRHHVQAYINRTMEELGQYPHPNLVLKKILELKPEETKTSLIDSIQKIFNIPLITPKTDIEALLQEYEQRLQEMNRHLKGKIPLSVLVASLLGALRSDTYAAFHATMVQTGIEDITLQDILGGVRTANDIANSAHSKKNLQRSVAALGSGSGSRTGKQTEKEKKSKPKQKAKSSDAEVLLSLKKEVADMKKSLKTFKRSNKTHPKKGEQGEDKMPCKWCTAAGRSAAGTHSGKRCFHKYPNLRPAWFKSKEEQVQAVQLGKGSTGKRKVVAQHDAERPRKQQRIVRRMGTISGSEDEEDDSEPYQDTSASSSSDDE
jgi:hypothetical protein